MSELSGLFCTFSHIIHRHGMPEWQLHPTPTDYYNLMFFMDGEAAFHTASGQFTARAGDVVWFSPGAVRSAFTSATHPLNCFAVNFQAACISRDSGNWKLDAPVFPFPDTWHLKDRHLRDITEARFRALCNAWHQDTPDRQDRCRELFHPMIRELAEWQQGRTLPYAQAQVVALARDYLAAHLTEPVTLEDLSRETGVSIPHLVSLFRSATGHSPMATLAAFRLQKARELLSEGHPVHQVATDCGFSDPSYFSRFFRQHTGIAPSRWT